VSPERRLSACSAAARTGLALALAFALLVRLLDAAAAVAERAHLSAWAAGVPSPDFRLEDMHDAAATMQRFRGYITVVTFGYANCPGMCSLELQKLARAVRALGARQGHVRVVFITLDPERDTPAQLAHFVQQFDSAFVALRGSAAQTEAAAKRFSIESARIPGPHGYLIDHPIEEFVFDGGGRLRFIGVADSTAEELAACLSKLVSPALRQNPSSTQ
jgi:protein SCO1/2